MRGYDFAQSRTGLSHGAERQVVSQHTSRHAGSVRGVRVPRRAAWSASLAALICTAARNLSWLLDS